MYYVPTLYFYYIYMNKKTILGTIAVLAATTLGAFAAVPNTIVDVTNGLKIRWVVTPADASGFAKAAYTKQDGYQLHAVLDKLDDPKIDDFYEGWVVRKSPFAFISTGKLTKESDGKWHNKYASDIDYTDYDFYVLTLEPNDGNDAPADHIVEGDVTIVESFDTSKKNDSGESRHVTFDITGKNFSFSQDKIEVYEGDTVTINFESTEWFHDWWVDEFDAWTSKVSAGWKTSVTFVADKAWSFEFYCSVGNHRGLGMSGWLIVKVKEAKKEVKKETKTTPKKHDTQKKKVADNSKQIKLKKKINKLVAKLSTTKKAKLKKQVLNLESKLPKLKISESKRERYREIIDLLLEAL